MILLLNRLEKSAAQKGYFSELQFGFSEGVGCIEASFTILETINHMLERGSKVFNCFRDVRKAFDTVWIDGLLFKLFSDLGINGRMWLALYINGASSLPWPVPWEILNSREREPASKTRALISVYRSFKVYITLYKHVYLYILAIHLIHGMD